MWIEKYRPRSLKEFVNQKDAVRKFLEWIKSWKPGAKALLLYGPPGTGKTCLVQAYAAEKNLDLIEMNASDYRSALRIQSVMGQSMMQASLTKKGKIFLLDEIDGIAGREDSGGIKAIIKMIKSSVFPVVLTANDPYEKKLRELRKYCELVEFRKIPFWDIVKKLREICKKEEVKVPDEVLKNIAKRSGGDLRAAITDLEVVCRGKKEVSIKDLEALGFREKEETIFEALKLIFKTNSAKAAKLSILNVDKDPDEIFWWIENNVAIEYEKPEEIAKAFDFLSKADLFRKWVTSRQNWRLRKYQIDLMTAGVAVSKEKMYKKFTKYSYPSNLAILGASKTERKEERVILEKLSQLLHCSTRKVKKEFYPYFKILSKNKAFIKHLSKVLEVEESTLRKLF